MGKQLRTGDLHGLQPNAECGRDGRSRISPYMFVWISLEGALGIQRLNSAETLIQSKTQGGSPMECMYYIGWDVHKKPIRDCVKNGSGRVHAEGAIPAT